MNIGKKLSTGKPAFLNLMYTAIFLILTVLILTHSSASLHYALNGLNLWFTKMIPALFPFMILSGIMIRLKLTEHFSALLYPVLGPVFRARKNVCYAIIMGFLCGFPMGAKVTCDLLERNMITETEAKLLLAFCNNIGPVYFCSFVLPLLERRLVWPYIFGMYGIPFLYGAILNRTVYHTAKPRYTPDRRKAGTKQLMSRELTVCEDKVHSASTHTGMLHTGMLHTDMLHTGTLLAQIDDAILSSIHSILMLGGYMIFFNLLNLIPHVLGRYVEWGGIFPGLQIWLTLCAPIFEITGGLSMLGTTHPLFSLLLLSFGGLSCIAQTYSMIKNSGLSIGNYVIHKLVLTILTGCFYLGWYLILPSAFLL